MHRCSILTLVYLSCASHLLIAKSCFAMQPFLSVYPVYDSPCMTWTVYWTLILRRLPTLILPALFTDYSECLPPAPIQSLSSDSDSALPTLRLKLVIKLCLSDLHTLLIKLHMDPNALDSSLQWQRIMIKLWYDIFATSPTTTWNWPVLSPDLHKLHWNHFTKCNLCGNITKSVSGH